MLTHLLYKGILKRAERITEARKAWPFGYYHFMSRAERACEYLYKRSMRIN